MNDELMIDEKIAKAIDVLTDFIKKVEPIVKDVKANEMLSAGMGVLSTFPELKTLITFDYADLAKKWKDKDAVDSELIKEYFADKFDITDDKLEGEIEFALGLVIDLENIFRKVKTKFEV
jgi:hypothetical protein